MSDADDADATADADDPDGREPDGRNDDGPARDVIRVDGVDETDPARDEGEAGADTGGDDGPPVGRDGVVDPDDLDIRDRDGVDETDDGRYVISTGGGRRDDLRDGVRDDARDGVSDDAGSRPARTGSAGGGDAPADADGPAPPTPTASPAAERDRAGDPLEAVADELGGLSASHGFALAVAAGGETDTLRVASGEPTDTLATALRWYARRVNPGEPAEETIAELLAASDLAIE